MSKITILVMSVDIVSISWWLLETVVWSVNVL